MHIHVVPNRGSPPTVLLRESYREGSKVAQAHAGQSVEPVGGADRGHSRGPARRGVAAGGAVRFEITASRSHGHVQAVALAMQRLGFASLMAAKPCRERDLVLAMVAARIVAPAHQAGHHALVAHHDAGRGLRRGRCQRGRSVRGDGLAARAPGRDPEEARRAPPARRRPGALRPVVELLRGQHLPAGQAAATTATARRGMLQVNYGLLTDARGCPVAVSVYEGNTADSQTLHARGASGCARTSASSSW